MVHRVQQAVPCLKLHLFQLRKMKDLGLQARNKHDQ